MDGGFSIMKGETYMATKAMLELEKIDNNDTNEVYTLEEVRHKNRINIALPYVNGGG